MSKKVCIFNDDWLTDPRFSTWIAKDKTKVKAKCNVCNCSFTLSNMGIGAVISHSAGKRHVNKINCVKKTNDFFKLPSQSSVANDASSLNDVVAPANKTVQSYMISTNTLNAEIYWALKVVMSHYSLRSCVGLNDLFKVMFSDSEIANSFALSRTKCTYLINFGLSPIFKSKLIKDIQSSPYFVASYDESMNRISQDEQMDVQIRYWNDLSGLVETRYFDSKFIKRPNAVNLLEELNKALTELPVKNMLQLSMDGPNTNWKVLELLNNQRSELELSELLDIGSCGLHVIHGAFRTGVEATSWNIKKILKSIWQLFHDSPARRDIYIKQNQCQDFPLR